MDYNFIYFVLGILVTVIVGIIGIIYSNKRGNERQVKYIQHKCISLFSKVITDLDELQVLYKGKDVNQDLLIYEFSFHNSGVTDIDKSETHSPLIYLLPKQFEWKSAVITTKTNSLNLDINTESNKLKIEWDIFKSNEFFKLETIIEKIEQSDDNDFDSRKLIMTKSKFEHRIKNLNRIELTTINSEQNSIFGAIASTIFLGIISFFVVSYNGNILLNGNQKEFYTTLDKGKEYSFYVDKSTNYFTLRDEFSTEINKVRVEDFDYSIFSQKPQVRQLYQSLGSKIGRIALIVFFMFLFLALTILHFSEWRENRSNMKLVENVEASS